MGGRESGNMLAVEDIEGRGENQPSDWWLKGVCCSMFVTDLIKGVK